MCTYQLHRNGKYWQVRWTDSRGRRRGLSLGAITQREADQCLQDIIAQHATNPNAKDITGDIKLSAWLARYIEIRGPELGKATKKVHRLTCDRLFEFFSSDPKLADITKHQATDWRLWLGTEKNLVESTVCKHVRAAKVIFARAISEGVIVISPVEHLKSTPPVKDHGDRRFVRFEEIEAVSDHINAGTWAVIILCYYAGLRFNEAVNLQWKDLDLNRGILTVRSDGEITSKKRTRQVRIEGDLAFTLRLFSDIVGHRRGTETVCGIHESGPKNPHRALRKACEAAVIEPFTFKDLRATRDTIWHDKYPSHVVCAWIGHSEKVARDHYLSVPDEYYDGGDA